MKKLLFFFLLFFFSFPVLAKEQKLLGLGDSITTGYGVGETEPYFSLLCDHFQKEQPTLCENKAVNGFTSTQLLEQIKEELQKQIQEADMIVFSIGGNDYLQELTTHLWDYLGVTSDLTRFHQVSQTLLNNLELILKELRKQNPEAQILVVPLYNPYYELLKQNTTLMSAFEEVQTDYTNLVNKYAKTSKTLGLSLQTEQYLNASKTNLDPHPTALGHAYLAEQLLLLVEEPSESPSYLPLIIGLLFPLGFVLLVTLLPTKKKF